MNDSYKIKKAIHEMILKTNQLKKDLLKIKESTRLDNDFGKEGNSLGFLYEDATCELRSIVSRMKEAQRVS